MLAQLSAFLIARRRFVVAVLVVVQVGLLVDLAARVDWTADERTWLLAGHAFAAGVNHGLPELRLQGPLGLLANQLFVTDLDPAAPEPAMLSARLGMLFFPVLLLLVAERFARQAYGPAAGLTTALLVAFSPTVLGNGALLANDVALAATALASVHALWRWLIDPRPWRPLALGIATGAMLATKHSSLVIAASMPVVVLLAVARGFDPRRAREGRSGAALASVAWLVVAGAVALLVLHAAYLFGAGTLGLERVGELESNALRAVAAIPGGALLLAVLPEPFVLGADYQAVVSVEFSGRFLDHMGPHPAYYPVSLATKCALPVLLLFLASLISPPRRASPFSALCLAVPAGTLLGYLVLANALQGGVRYVLPVLAAMLVRAGAFAESRDAATGVGRVAVLGLGAWLVLGTLAAHPRELGHFNAFVGGPVGGWRVFADINCDWRQELEPGRRAIAARHEGVEFLDSADGPRFGKVAAYALDLKPPDPERPGRTWHWLWRFEPIDHHSAAWLVFDVVPDEFVALAKAGDARAARDLSLAWLGYGDLVRARAALELPGDGRAEVAELLRLIERAERDEGPASVWREIVERLRALGRDDLALRYLDRLPCASIAERFLALVRGGREAEGLALLRAVQAQRGLEPAEAMLLATAELRRGDFVEARLVLDRAEPPEAGPLLERWRDLRAQVERAVTSLDALEGR